MAQDYESDVDERDLALALRRLNAAVIVPQADPARHAALMAAFDAAQQRPGGTPRRRHYWHLAGFAAAAAILIAAGLGPTLTGRHRFPRDADPARTAVASTDRGVQPEPRQFVAVPGAALLPAMESGSLVRMNIPVAMLPSLGVLPPGSQATAVKADLVIGQDGLARAIRLVD